ncbi:hypothetical protein QC334_31310 [Streptomyces sp. DH18]|uniref:hypothetical protein n=1 Tax=unclassified Streptomyces TaxID=2593676 RepID=UPI001E3C12C4|nr:MULTISPECIES: hypothetical protein [unclassified Streptomyces]MDG9687168.1 hypothetical protein [Streptomyces sp. DH18]
MSAKKTLFAAAAGLTTGALVLRRLTANASLPADQDRWLVVTVQGDLGEVRPDDLPAPLRDFGDRIETRITPAPGDRGTEIAVRFTRRGPKGSHSAIGRISGDDPRQDLRLALRKTKALLETGEVMQADAPSTTHETPGGKLIGLLSRRAGGEGVL